MNVLLKQFEVPHHHTSTVKRKINVKLAICLPELLAIASTTVVFPGGVKQGNLILPVASKLRFVSIAMTRITKELCTLGEIVPKFLNLMGSGNVKGSTSLGTAL